MRNSLGNIKRRIKLRDFFSVMFVNLLMLGIGYPLLAVLFGLFFPFFPSFAIGGSNFLEINTIIKYIQDGLLMGFFSGLFMNAIDIFLFTEESKKEEINQI